MSNALNYLIAVFLILATSCNSQKGDSNTVTTNASHGIVSVKTLYKTPPIKGSGLAYYEYHYTNKFIPFLSETFWKNNRNQPKDEPIRMQFYTETTFLEPGYTSIITTLSGQLVEELLILKKEKEGFTKVLGKKLFDVPCTFINVRLMYLTNKKYPDFVVSCVSNKVYGVMILQWNPPASLLPLSNEGFWRSGPGKAAKPVYEISPNEMKLYPNKIKMDVFQGDAMGNGVEIKKIDNETKVIEHGEVSNNYYKWNGKVFELIKVEKITKH
jgi:hypothetical protein